VAGYVYDQSFAEERARLAGMEAQWDPGTFRHLEALGLPSNASCWEIGGGGGTVAAWMAERFASVLVTDLDTRFVEPLASETVRVERHDVVADPLPDERFDLIHARLLIEHLPQRDQVLDRLVEALAPGGWLLIEDYDWTSFDVDPPSETITRVTEAVIAIMVSAGFEPRFGRRVLRGFLERGLVEAGAEARTLLLNPSHPGSAFYRLSLMSLRDAVIARGQVTEAEVDEVLSSIDDDSRWLVTPAMFATWGRRPG
jgi:SAM-dependent methyltransferase